MAKSTKQPKVRIPIKVISIYEMFEINLPVCKRAPKDILTEIFINAEENIKRKKIPPIL